MERDLKWATLSSEYIHRDRWFNARRDRCRRPDGKIVEPYYVLEYMDWACALPVTEDGRIVLIRQYRHALGEVCIELPGGCIEPGEAPSVAASRELREETGYDFSHIHALGRTSSNPSTNTNLMHMFVATGGKPASRQQLDENEEIEVFTVSFEELMQLLDRRQIIQSMHVTTIYYALQYLDEHRLLPPGIHSRR